MPEKLKTFRPHGLKPKGPEHVRVYYTKAWAALRRVVLQRDHWKCQICGKELRGADATVDHIIEMQSGGVVLPCAELLQALCRACNSRKGRRTQVGPRC